jgi:hypothetical protein
MNSILTTKLAVAYFFVSILLLGGAIFLTIPEKIKAHSFGLSFEEVIGEYFVDIGASEWTVYQGKPVRYDFELYEADDQTKRVPYTDLWVRISYEGQTVYASNLHYPSLGSAGMTLPLNETGDYKFEVRFHNDSETLVEQTVVYPVQEMPTQTNIFQYIAWGLGGITATLAVFLAGFLLSMKLQKKS